MQINHPKILFFVTEDWFVVSHWLPLIEGAINSGFQVTVVTRTNNHTGKILKLGVKLIHLEISRQGLNIFSELITFLRLMKIYRKERPDIVHHVAMKPILYGSLASRLLMVPHTVNWVAGLGWLFISYNWRAKILKVIIQRALSILLNGTSVIVENRDDQAIVTCTGLTAKHIHLIRGAGVNTVLYSPTPEPSGVPLVILPARMLWDKGVGEFVESATQLKKQGVIARFILVGEPDMENPASVSKHQLQAWNKEGAIEWWGRQEDMPRVFAQSHIVCLPSYREGLPKSLLEAASCGRPIVTTDVPGCREVVHEGVNGFLVESRNAVPLTAALKRLLADPKLRRKMGQNGRKLMLTEFSQESIVAQVLEIYRKKLFK